MAAELEPSTFEPSTLEPRSVEPSTVEIGTVEISTVEIGTSTELRPALPPPPALPTVWGAPTPVTAVVDERQRREADELARALLVLAQRSARETREATRVECELMLKKARERAANLGAHLERRASATSRELQELQALRFELREQMRASLTDLIRTCSEEGNGFFPLDPTGELGGYAADPRRFKAKKKSKSKFD